MTKNLSKKQRKALDIVLSLGYTVTAPKGGR